VPLITAPRLNLGQWPTPLHELPRLTAALGGPRLFIKRDDLTGLALGGNKCRKLEYVLAEAQRQGVDALITTGASQSNFALQMAAAGRKLGLESHLVLIKGLHSELQGNLLLHHLLGSKVTILELADISQAFTVVPRKMEELAEELRRQGRKPLVIPAGATMPLGNAGWFSAAEEIGRQIEDQKIELRAAVLACGSGGTQAGLTLGVKKLGLPFQVVGISVFQKKEEARRIVADQASQTARLFDLGVSLDPEEVTVYDDYLGPGYGLPTGECLEAIRLTARTEAIFLDPVYTGKAMAGLIDLSRQGVFTSRDAVLFIHTGGVAADFAYQPELTGSGGGAQ